MQPGRIFHLGRIFHRMAARPRPPSHRLFAVYSGALSPTAALRLRLAASVQTAQEPLRG